MLKILIDKCLSFFINKKKTDDLSSNEKDSMSIRFILYQNNDMEIEYDIPYHSHKSLQDITSISERYAEMLLGINCGLLKNQVIENLKLEGKDTNDNNKILIIDNIIAFYDILKKEMIKSSVLYNQPVIMPSSVFNTKKLDGHNF